MGVPMQERLIPTVSHEALTPQGWRAQWGSPWPQDCSHKQIFSSHAEMLSQNLPAPSVPVMGAFLISDS